MNIKRMRCGIAASVLSAVMLIPVGAADFGGEVLGNADIISLSRAGMAPELIIAKIQATPNTFDLSTRAMIAMKENGVPDQVMGAVMAAAQNAGGRTALDQSRFARELENIAVGGESARTAGLAWMLSNRPCPNCSEACLIAGPKYGPPLYGRLPGCANSRAFRPCAIC